MAETYLAGLGVTGAVIAAVVSAFLLILGMVVFDAWPRAATLAGPRAEVEAVSAGESAATAERPGTGAIGALPRDASSSDTILRGDAGGTGGAPGGGDDGGGVDTGDPGGGGQVPAGSPPAAGGATSGGGGASSGGGTVQQTVDDLGQTVDNTVSGLSETVNDTVTGLGQTVNGTLDGVNRVLNGLTNTGS